MSRIGKKAVTIPDGVTATMEDGLVKVKGPKGELSTPMVDDLTYELGDGGLMVTPANKSKQARSFWGMQRTLVQNLVDGVTEGFSRRWKSTALVIVQRLKARS